jgi:hypothetical protein
MPKVGDLVQVGESIGIILRTDERTIPTVCYVYRMHGVGISVLCLTQDDFKIIA